MSDDRGESVNIINALRRGTVPGSGLSRLAVGIEVEEGVIARQLGYVADGGGDLKFIKGDYGAGKTFLLARARRRRVLALHEAVAGFAVLALLKFVPYLGLWVWTVASFIAVGAALTSKFGRREPWFSTQSATTFA